MKKLVLATLIIISSVSGSLSGVTPVRSGEHENFSRLVVMLEQKSEWSLSRDKGDYELRIKTPGVEFDLTRVFNLIQKLRIKKIDPIGESNLRIMVADNTHATAFELANGSIVIDIKDGKSPPDSIFERTPADVRFSKFGREHGLYNREKLQPLNYWRDNLIAHEPPVPKDHGQFVTEDSASLRLDLRDASAETELLQQLGRSASEGLLELDLGASAKLDNSSDDSPRLGPNSSTDQPLATGEHLAIRAITSINRNIQGAEQGYLLTENGEECSDGSQFDLSVWLKDTTPSDQIASLRHDLLGEFDRPLPEKITALARLYVALGFGDEATQLLDTLGASLEDVEALRVMARIIDERPVDPSSKVRQMADCDAPVALWAVLANEDLRNSSMVNFGAVLRAFSALPLAMRKHIGPRLAERMIAVGSPNTARSIQAAISRTAGDNEAAVDLIEARIDMAAGNPYIAESRVAPLIAENGPLSIEATLLAMDARLAIGGVVDAQMIANLAALAFEYRTVGDGVRIARAYVLAAGSAGRFDEAFGGLEQWPKTENGVMRLKTMRELFQQMLTNPNDEIFMKSIFSYQDLIGDETGDRELRSNLATRLISLGFASLARDLIGSYPKISDRDRLILAQASIVDQDGSAALVHILGLSDTRTEEIRGAAFSLLGDHLNARAAFERAGDKTAADRETWAMGGPDTISSLDAHTQHTLSSEVPLRESLKIKRSSEENSALPAEDVIEGILGRDLALIRESQDMRENLNMLLSDRDIKDSRPH